MEIFIKVVSRKMETLYMVLIGFSQESYLSPDLLVIFKLKNLNMEVIQMFLSPNLKLLISPSILHNMILLWWDLMAYLTKWKIKISHNNFGLLKISQLRCQNHTKQTVKISLSLEKPLQKSLLKQWKICPSIILQLFLLFSILMIKCYTKNRL